MTLYERITGEVSEILTQNRSMKGLTVDIPKIDIGYDLYSNAFKLFGEEFSIEKNIDFVKDFSVDNGFLNIHIKDEILLDFLSEFDVLGTESDIDGRILAYIQLAENEKNYCDIKDFSMPLTSDVRRIILFLMKIQYLYSTGTKKTDIIESEIIEILDKIRVGCESLRSFVITYEPLLIAVRGSLAKF